MTDDPCLCTSLRQAAHMATEIYDRALEPTGLKITMFRVLRRLSEAKEPTITELARIVELDRSTLGRNLRVLERMKLVTFSDADDERARVVVLTPLGRSTLDEAKPLWRKAQARMRAVLGDSAAAIHALRTDVSEEAARQRA